MINTTLIILIIISYIICSIWCIGLFFAHSQGYYPVLAVVDRRQDLGKAIIVGLSLGLFSIIGVGLAYLLTGFGEYGWRIK